MPTTTSLQRSCSTGRPWAFSRGEKPLPLPVLTSSKNSASMPIRKSIIATSRRVGRQSALKLFTDRDHERQLLRNFFERLARFDRERDIRPEKPILSIWGVGGIGKTSLLKKASEELGNDLACLRLVSLDL